MSTRSELLGKLEGSSDNLALTLINGQKQPGNLFSTQIALDILPILYDILEEAGPKKTIKLLLRSNGGILDSPLPIINLIREYCNELIVYVPEIAHSAATLIALGADKIIMSPLGSLSPIDPQLSLKGKSNQDQEINMNFSVEDVAGYYKLLEKMKISEDGRIKALDILAKTLNPTVLGQIERVRDLIKILAHQLLKPKMQEEGKREIIIKKLVEDIPSHSYRISRREASEIGLPVEYENDEEHILLKEIMTSYRKALSEDQQLILNFPDGTATIESLYSRAFIETKTRSFSFNTKYVFHRNTKVDQVFNSWQEQNNGN